MNDAVLSESAYRHTPLFLDTLTPQPLRSLDNLRVAVVHEWLVNYAGSEKVVEQILQMFPQADIFAVVDFLPDAERGLLGGRTVHTSFIQKLPKARTAYRNYLPLMPLAVEQFDLSAYDLVISSSHAVAKGVLTGPAQVHVSYVHTPMRYAWDLQHQYLRESGLAFGFKSALARLSLHYLRLWDSRTVHGVDTFIANSAFIARRIRKVYGRDAEVVYPPVDISRFALRDEKEDFYLAASRMVPYKCMPMIAEAFAGMPQRRLVLIGDGPDLERVRTISARASNITVLGYTSADVLVDHMGRARALIFAAEEDFGITPVEAQACGTPVIAYGAGGVLESVLASEHADQRTGMFFRHQSADSICKAVDAFESVGRFTPRTCRENAERFSIETFRKHLGHVLRSAMSVSAPKIA
ncbi:MAG: glycosyltransferase family 4 protein [Pseudomonadota bacterium]